MSVMKYYKRITAIVLFIAVTICSILPTGLEARAAEVTESNPMYRLYNPNSGEHFYTADEGEKDYLSGIGWNYEGIGWNAPVSSNSPVYRLYNPYSSDHHYTMDEGERDYLSQTGWNYEGIGWYSDDAKSVPLYRQFNPNEVIGTHNYTKSLEENDWLCSTGWQAEGIGWYGVHSSSDDEHENEPLVESEKSVENYAVINLEVDQFTKSVNAKVGAPGNCKLLVRFVPEDVYFADGYYSGKEYINDGATQASCDVVASDEFVEVGSVIDNADALPDNYVAEAVLVDANGNNLCSPYTSIENTRRHEEFEAKDIYSFEGHNVVNFDQDATTNFGVLEDDVKILTAEEIVEEVNEDESKNYTITSPSENIEVGDKVYIKDGTGEYLFKVAEKNTLSDGKIFVKAARANDANHGFKLEDFFTYIDYETDGYREEMNKKYSSNEKLAYKERTFTFNSPPLDAKAFKIDASISGTVGVELNIEVDKQVYGKRLIVDYECTLSQKNKVTLTPSGLSEKIEYNPTLGKVRIPIALIADAYVKVGLEFSCKVSATVSAEGTSTITAGLHYDSVGGYSTSSQKENNWEFAVKGEVEIKMGPTIAVGAEVLAGVVAIDIEGFVGLVANATIEAKTGSNTDHKCDVCASGVLKASTELSLNLLLLDFGNDPYKPFKVTLISAEKPLFEFYVSIVNPSGEIKSGKGKCPYKNGGSYNPEESALFNMVNGVWLDGSGAGAWHEHIIINSDGSFEYNLNDRDFGTWWMYDATGEFYPPEKIDEYTYRITVKNIQYTIKPDEYDGDFGETIRYREGSMKAGDVGYIYLPGKKTSEIEPDYLRNVKNFYGVSEAIEKGYIDFYGYYMSGFYTDEYGTHEWSSNLISNKIVL